MKYQIQEKQLTISLPKKMDGRNIEKIIKKIEHLVKKRNITCIFLDFKHTCFFDISGIKIIMCCHRILHPLGGKVEAVNLSAEIKKILIMSGVTKIIQIKEDGK